MSGCASVCMLGGILCSSAMHVRLLSGCAILQIGVKTFKNEKISVIFFARQKRQECMTKLREREEIDMRERREEIDREKGKLKLNHFALNITYS